jgi:hypothetical protein
LETGKADRELRAAVRRFRELRSAAVVGEVDMRPGCAFGVMVQTGVDDVRDDLADVKAELAWVRKVIVMAILTAAIATLLRLGGLG